MLGRDLEALIHRAREFKKQYGDSFVSVEHLVLGFVQDKRFGKQLFKEFEISERCLQDAIQAIRGPQNVVDQGPFFPSPFHFLLRFRASAKTWRWICPIPTLLTDVNSCYEFLH